jgi:hypothetical protein
MPCVVSLDHFLLSRLLHILADPLPFHIGTAVRIPGAAKPYAGLVGAVAVHGLVADRAERPISHNGALPPGKELSATQEAEVALLPRIGLPVFVDSHRTADRTLGGIPLWRYTEQSCPLIACSISYLRTVRVNRSCSSAMNCCPVSAVRVPPPSWP